MPHCPAFVCLSVCLSVSNYIYVKTTDLYEYFTTDVSLPVDEEELIKFWKSSASGSGSSNFFKKDFTTL